MERLFFSVLLSIGIDANAKVAQKGDSIRICLFDSESKNGVDWSGKLPICEPKCPLLKWPNNGFIACSNNNLVGSRCDYTCDDDFILRGKSETTCLSFNETISKWDNATETTCNPLCNPILTFENGEVNCTGRAEEDICTFKCGDLFNIIGYRKSFNLYLPIYYRL